MRSSIKNLLIESRSALFEFLERFFISCSITERKTNQILYFSFRQRKEPLEENHYIKLISKFHDELSANYANKF